jgi:hypothetical protein
MAQVERTLPLDKILDVLGHEERMLKNIGAHAQAAGVRASIVHLLKLADETPIPLDPSE